MVKRGWWWVGLAAAVLAVGLAWLMGRILPPAYDFFGVYYPAIRAVWTGTFSYATQPGFLNPPWALLLMMPLGVFDAVTARALLLLMTFGAIVWSLRAARHRLISTTLCIVSTPMLAVMWLGQIEVFSIVGVALAYRAVTWRQWVPFAGAMLLLFVKPQETWLSIIWVSALAARCFSRREWMKIGTAVGGTASFSTLLFGSEWIARLAGGTERYSAQWQNFSLWRWSEFLPIGLLIGLVLISCIALLWAVVRLGWAWTGLGLVVTLGNVFSPYLTSAHLMMTLTFGWSALIERRLRLGLLVYALSLTPLLRWVNADQALNRWDVLFPIGVAASLVWLTRDH